MSCAGRFRVADSSQDSPVQGLIGTYCARPANKSSLRAEDATEFWHKENLVGRQHLPSPLQYATEPGDSCEQVDFGHLRILDGPYRPWISVSVLPIALRRTV